MLLVGVSPTAKEICCTSTPNNVFNQTYTGITEINSGERRLVSMSNNFDLYDYYEHLVLKDNNGVIIDTAWHSNYR